jgi:hypothetical protein
VYLERGAKRTFAGAIAWPGWSRSGRDEAAALQALVDAGPRYAAVLQAAGLAAPVPAAGPALRVVERLTGTMTTDFGAPDLAPAADARPVSPADLEWLQAILAACWQAFDAAVAGARGRELRKGPRGGGRDLDAIVAHVTGAEAGYLTALGGRREPGGPADGDPLRAAIRRTLAAAARGEIPARGPRGGVRWSPRYFVRRAAWHVLDHVWEIEDRLLSRTGPERHPGPAR